MQVTAKYSMQTLYFNVHGVELNPKILHIENGQMSRKVREFFFKNPAVRAFLKGLDKKDEKYIISVMRNIEIECFEKVI